VGVCGNGIVDDGETCGEPTLPACENGLLCVECACRELGDCQNNGNGVDLFDVIEKIDLVLQRHQPTPAQLVLCDDDCNMKIDLFDILNEIDVVLGVTTPPLVCAP
jgi:hypothetical protein